MLVGVGQRILNNLATIKRGSEIIILPPVKPDVSPANTPSLRASYGKRSYAGNRMETNDLP